MELVELDGSFGEGGGQVLRNSTSLAAILGVGISIENIRFKRPKPGLRPQHLMGVRAAVDISGAASQGVKENSTSLTFQPLGIVAKDLTFDIGTAGAITLIAQILLPIMVYAEKAMKVTIVGGTNVNFSPPVEFMEHVLLARMLPRFGVHAEVRVLGRGYFPRGGGRVELTSVPLESGRAPQAVEILEKGVVHSVWGVAHVCNLPRKIAERMRQAAIKKLRRVFRGAELNIEVVEERGVGEGTGLFLMAESDTGALYGWNEMGERRKSAEKVAEDCADALADQVLGPGCVDEHLQDQVIIFMMLAEGTSRMRVTEVTEHTETSLHFCKLISGADYSVEPDGDSFIVTVIGIGKPRSEA